MTDSPTSQSSSSGIRVVLYGQTDVGRIREHNEDNFVVANLTTKSRDIADEEMTVELGPEGLLMAVCDGMGGAAAGEVASEIAVDTLYEHFTEHEPPADHDELGRRVIDAIQEAGRRIYAEAKTDRSHRGMGTTSTVAALVDKELFLGEIGDSRGYLLRGEKMVQVTRDQSLVNQLIEANQLTEEEAETFEHNNIILQALGTSDSVQVDLTHVDLRRGDTLMLCSDGLSGLIRYEQIRQILLAERDTAKACRVLIEQANEAGGHDNITCIVARFEGDGLKAPSDDDPELQFERYEFEDDAEETAIARRPSFSKKNRPSGERLTDHGPSKSKLGQTMTGAMSPLADLPLESPGFPEDKDELPMDAAPLWILGAVVVAVFGGLVLAAYFVIFQT